MARAIAQAPPVSNQGVAVSFDFINGPATGDTRLVTTRAAGGATYFDQTNTLQMASANTQRIDYGPIPQTTNIVFPSINWASAATPGATDGVTQNAGLAPDGSSTAMKIIPGTNNTVHQWFRSFTGQAATNYVHSVYAKPAGYNFLYISLDNTGFLTATAIFDISTGTLVSSGGGTATITPAPNGYYRCSISGTSSNAGPPYVANVRTASTSNNTFSVWSGDAVDGALVWGDQVELTTNVTPGVYVPTTTAIGIGSATPVGLLVEESRTNTIHNPRCEGAVNGTPGTLPATWFFSNTSGLTSTVVGSGYETGIPYVDLQLSGTSTGGNVTLITDDTNGTSATTNSVWANSLYCKLVGGSLTNVVNFTFDIQAMNSSLTLLTTYNGSGFTPTTSPLASQRQSNIVTVADATVAFIRQRFNINILNASAVNVTVRIGCPQLELGSFVTSPILPVIGTRAASQRQAETILTDYIIPVGTKFSIICEALHPTPTGPANVWQLATQDASQSARVFFRNNGTEPACAFEGSLSGTIDVASIYNNVVFRHGVSYSPGTMNVAVTGTSYGSQAVTGGPIQPLMALTFIGGVPFNGYIRNWRLWKRTMAAAELVNRTT